MCLHRDQNFGLNELAAIQDVRNEYNLQDITDEPPSSSPTTNDRGKSYTYGFDCLTTTKFKKNTHLPTPTCKCLHYFDR